MQDIANHCLTAPCICGIFKGKVQIGSNPKSMKRSKMEDSKQWKAMKNNALYISAGNIQRNAH
jgi:hypothetical protein